MEDNPLFGVPLGGCTGCCVAWRQQQDGTDQVVTLELSWRSRKSTTLTAHIPDDQQLAQYVSACMPLVMNGAWMHKGRLYGAYHKVHRQWSEMGAETTSKGTRVPAAY